MSRVIGIDLGTTNSVVAILENNRAEVIQNSEGAKTTPSIVYYGEGGEVLVGELAKRHLVIEPARTIKSVKRFMGCRMSESDQRTKGIRYRLRAGEEDMVEIDMESRALRPEEISADILKKMKATAEAFLGESVAHAVITVPAHFNDSQRQATKHAAELAGLTALRIINEPTAAALAYGLNKQNQEKVAVFDFGGGTFDISILELDRDVFEVKSTGGDTFLGGDNINQLLFEWIMEKIREQTGLELESDLKASQRVAEEAEKIKCELSTLKKTLISLPFIGADASGPKHFSTEITREEFETLIRPILARLRPPCEAALKDAGLTAEQLSTVILVGGSTRIPAVREFVQEIFGRTPDCSQNPDEVVACGAAIQGGIMTGDLAELLLLDVTPLSLGIELAGDVFSVLIPRNSNVPTTVKKKFTTVVDNQSVVRIHVLQGERKIASHDRSLAHLRLTDIAPAPREIPEIEVSFTIDANGILTVGALDLTTGFHKEIQVESFTPASEGEAERAVREAAEAVQEDQLFLQKAAVRRRLREMEIEIEAVRQSASVSSLTSEQDRAIREAFFKLDIALAGDVWEGIEDAERAARGIFTEITSMHALKTGTPAKREDDVIDLSSAA